MHLAGKLYLTSCLDRANPTGSVKLPTNVNCLSNNKIGLRNFIFVVATVKILIFQNQSIVVIWHHNSEKKSIQSKSNLSRNEINSNPAKLWKPYCPMWFLHFSRFSVIC